MLGVDMSQLLYSNATMPLRIGLYVMATSRTDETHRFRRPWIHFAQGMDKNEQTPPRYCHHRLTYLWFFYEKVIERLVPSVIPRHGRDCGLRAAVDRGSRLPLGCSSGSRVRCLEGWIGYRLCLQPGVSGCHYDSNCSSLGVGLRMGYRWEDT